MQYLKEEVRNNILQAALEEFKDKGFLNASMRNIAKNAGVALGNVYRYFKNKSDLFNEIVEPAYKCFMQAPDIPEEECDGNAVFQLEHIVGCIMMTLKKYRTQLLILVDKSNGTKYENTKEELILAAENNLKEALLPALRNNGIEIENEFVFYVMAATFTEGVFIILRRYDDEEQIKYLIRQLIYIYFDDINNRFK